MTFGIGEKVVYPNQGVATIENISTRSFGAQFEKFYLLRLMRRPPETEPSIEELGLTRTAGITPGPAEEPRLH